MAALHCVAREGSSLTLQWRGGPEGLEPVRLAVLQHLTDSAVDRSAIYRCELVLEEIVLNIIRHVQAGPEGTTLELTVTVEAGRVELCFTDPGPPFDPTRHPSPPLPGRLEEAQPGGLGIHLVRRMTQGLTYTRDGDRNCLRVLVARTPAAAV